MPDLVLRSEEDARDFVRGCAFYGVGGGGSPADGLKLLLDDLSKVDEIPISDVHSISDDAWLCGSYGPGSIAPPTPEVLEKMVALGLSKRIGLADRMYTLALLELQNFAHVEIEGVVPMELGGLDGTPACMDAALAVGKKIVNGDFCGRAVPEMIQSTTFLNDVPINPSAYVDPWGNVTIVKHAINYPVAETLSKMLSVVACSYIGGAGFLMRGKKMKQVVIPNTLSECHDAGQVIREAVARREDPAQAIADATKGWVIFRGKVVKKDWQDKDGYMWGTNTIQGLDEFKDNRMKIYYKNENHITWLNEKPYVTSPDIISVVAKDSGEPLTNTDIKEGDFVSVLALRGRYPFRTPKGLNVLGPKHFGFDIPYHPVEEIADRKR